MLSAMNMSFYAIDLAEILYLKNLEHKKLVELALTSTFTLCRTMAIIGLTKDLKGYSKIS